jgi:hypothetical protein
MAEPGMSDEQGQAMILGEMRGQLREVVHSMNNLSAKFDGLSREVVGLSAMAGDLVDMKARTAATMPSPRSCARLPLGG